MLESLEKSPLFTILNPGSIAFFGASNNITAMGTTQLANLLKMGFPGKIYPVHPKEKLVQGLPAYARVEDLPQGVDLAVIVLPTRLVPETLQECGEKGIKRAIVISGGFKEVGPEGQRLERHMVEVAGRYGIRFLGPNCIGVVHPYARLNTTFNPYETVPGFIGMASQSGSFITQMFAYLAKFGLGFSAGVSVGNEANIDLVDCLEYLGNCPRTKVIALYIEGIRRGRKFLEAARSITPEKPIVAYYVGGSETGKKAGLSHTGALAGPDRLYEGVFRQSGIMRAHSIEELFDFCWVLGSLPLLRGNRVVVQTHSGGPGTATADTCGRVGLELPSLSPATREKLRPFVPHTASLNNPVDLTFIKQLNHYYSEIPEILLEDEQVDGLLTYFLMPRHSVMRALASMGLEPDRAQEEMDRIILELSRSFAQTARASSKPVIGSSFFTREDPLIRCLQDQGIPVLPSPERAARAMGALNLYARLRDKILSQKE